MKWNVVLWIAIAAVILLLASLAFFGLNGEL